MAVKQSGEGEILIKISIFAIVVHRLLMAALDGINYWKRQTDLDVQPHFHYVHLQTPPLCSLSQLSNDVACLEQDGWLFFFSVLLPIHAVAID